MKSAQFFCTIHDLIADKKSPGVDEARMMKAIREASEWIQKRMGSFVPTIETHSFQGTGKRRLLIHPTLLSITRITNDGVELDPSEYVLKPEDGYWTNGPFGELYVAEGAHFTWSCRQDGVVIEGHYGKYERSATIDATVQDDPQSEESSTLEVSDGGKVSPGMVLLVESEQEAIVGWGDATENVTAVNMAAGLDASDEVLVVDDASKVNIGEIMRLDFEQCRVADRRLSTNQLSIVRSWNGTARVAHADDTPLDVYRTVLVERGVNGTTAVGHIQGTQLARYLIPDDMNLLAKEIATLGANKAGSGYQGRTGNQETGVVFYNDIYPRTDIEQIRQNYYIPRM